MSATKCLDINLEIVGVINGLGETLYYAKISTKDPQICFYVIYSDGCCDLSNDFNDATFFKTAEICREIATTVVNARSAKIEAIYDRMITKVLGVNTYTLKLEL